MERLAVAISLQDENTRPFEVVWIVFKDFGILHPGNHVRRQNTIRRQFFVAVVRDPDLPPTDQLLN